METTLEPSTSRSALDELMYQSDDNRTNDSAMSDSSGYPTILVDGVPLMRCPEFQPFGMESTVLLGFITPIVILFGLLANCINFRIFTHKFMRSSLLNWYLAVLSVSDACILITGFFFICLPRIGEYFDDFDVVNFCIQIAPLNYPAGLTAQTASVWLTILMSTHRFIGVCLPFKTTRICTKTNCKIALAAVLTFALVFNSTRYFEVSTRTCYSVDVNYTLVVPVMTSLRDSNVYSMIYVVWLYFIAMFCIPFVSLITLNTMVILAIRKTSQLHYQVTVAASVSGPTTMSTKSHKISNNLNSASNDNNNFTTADSNDNNLLNKPSVSKGGGRQFSRTYSVFRKRGEMSKEISTSIMLVGVVVLFLFCNTLAFVVNILELIDSYGNTRITKSNFFHHMVDVSNVLVMMNASSNIFVYLSFSEKYRLLLKHYLSGGCFNTGDPLVDTTS